MQLGFTMIELIVVVALVSILVGIVVVYVIPYVNKAKDASTKASMDTAIKDSVDYFLENPDNFGSDYILSTTFWKARSAVRKVQNDAVGGTEKTDANGSTGTQDWCFCSKLKNLDNNVYCVDGRGTKHATTTGYEGHPQTCYVECVRPDAICDTTK